MSILYLHGFASSPQSQKARFFADRFAALGVPVHIPDLAQGDFEHLTVSRQLQVIEEAAKNGSYILIGSSLGGYLAALYASRHPENVHRLVLLAPAFGFYDLWVKELGAARLAEWREKGFLPIYHYGARRDMPLSYEFLMDASQYEPFPDARQPTLIFHGNQDPVVPVSQSLAFVENHPHAQLIRYSSGHELTDVLDSMWNKTERFLTGG